jgi:Rieske Fe-S protein
MHSDDEAQSEEHPAASRRTFLTGFTSLTMLGLLTAAYGGLAAMIGRFFFPAHPTRQGWLFVRNVAGISPGQAFSYQLPNGNPVHITHRAGPVNDGPASAFVALSSTCPHLGCQVHWQTQHERFFCPCHNGIFDAEGTAISGPPADAGQSLIPYPLRVQDGMLFIQVPFEQLATSESHPRANAAKRA